MATRNRVIYQSEAIFVSPDATGYHYTGNGGQGFHHAGQVADNVHVTRESTVTGQQASSVLQQLSRVQSANYNFTINRQDVNQYGQLGRIDSIVTESPTVSLDFSYYLTNGENERLLGFNVNGTESCVAGRLSADDSEGQNFFILTTKEGTDAINNDLSDGDLNSVISLGNGFLSDYSVDLSVGALPTANVTIEGFNIKTDVGTTGLQIPGIDPLAGTFLEGYTGKQFTVPVATRDNATGVGGIQESALRPGDISLDLQDAGELAVIGGGATNTNKTSCHVQSVSISVPLSRTVLERLGSNFGFTRVVDYPVNATVSISATLADLKAGNLLERIYEEETSGPRKGLSKAHDLEVTLRNPSPNAVLPGVQGDIAMKFTMKNSVLESESFSSTIGDNKSVDLTFSTQISGPQDLNNGLFIFGECSENTNHNGASPKWENGVLVNNDD